MSQQLSEYSAKKDVQSFWERASCGEELYLKGLDKNAFLDQSRKRYELEPYILEFAQFSKAQGKKVLEIGVGLGADHQNWAENGAILTGVDLTERAVSFTRKRLELMGLKSELKTADAENLPFAENSFDLVYSWGVLHHSPQTPKAILEVLRVLKKGGQAKIMVYHKYSFVGYMLWLRYGLLGLKPWIGLKEMYSKYLESPGTKAYTVAEAQELFSSYQNVKIKTVLTHGDLLESAAGQRHKGRLLNLARKIWPRNLIKKFFPNHGLFMLIEAQK
jgi:ubiquinone/menaquinone biosynthesis C-methylase UbiE